MPRSDSPASPDLMDPKKVAIGLDCSRSMVYKLARLGELQAVPLLTHPRAGARTSIRITRDSYEAYLARIKEQGRARFGAA